MPWILSCIRYATLNDARSISTIYQQSTQSAYQDFMSNAPIYSRLLDRLVPFWTQKLAVPPTKEQRLLVAEYDGQVIGFVEIGAVTSPLEVVPEDTGELHFLFVAPAFMAGGIGSRLLARATKLFREDGYRHRCADIEEEGAGEDADRGDADAPAAIDLDREHLERDREREERGDARRVRGRGGEEAVGRSEERTEGDNREGNDENHDALVQPGGCGSRSRRPAERGPGSSQSRQASCGQIALAHQGQPPPPESEGAISACL